MSSKLYVGGLPYKTNDAEMQQLFAQAGAVVSARVIIDKMSGRSRGFGFVEMASDEDAQKAITMFNGQEYEGRKLIVNEARPMEERAPRRDNGGYGGGNRGGYNNDRGGNSGGYGGGNNYGNNNSGGGYGGNNGGGNRY